MAELIEIENFPALAKALADTGPAVRKALRKGLVELAQPIARDATRFAIENISGIGREKTSHWEDMRVGVARGFSLVYVAPRQRGVKGRGDLPGRRPGFADTLRDRAMAPAVDANEESLIAGADGIVNAVTGRYWNA